MQEGLRELINSASLRSKLSGNGIKSLKTYSISNITERYENLITEIIN